MATIEMKIYAQAVEIDNQLRAISDQIEKIEKPLEALEDLMEGGEFTTEVENVSDAAATAYAAVLEGIGELETIITAALVNNRG